MRFKSRSTAILVFVSFALLSHANTTGSSQTLLVMTRSHADIPAFEDRLASRGLTVLREIHCKTYGYSIFQVRPNTGSAEAALESLTASKDADLAAAEPTFDSHLVGCTPDIDDPDRDTQWNLDSMNFDAMRCLLEAHNVKQTVQPRITLIDSGLIPIKKEMNKNILRQFNFVGGVNGVEEDTFIDEYTNAHGTAVTSVAAVTTNNGKFLASPASCNKPVKITMCRVAEDDAIDTLDVLDAMTWCVDNQAIRGGPGAINLSVNIITPTLPTYNGSSVVQGIAKSAFKQGDLFVNAAGNLNIEDPSPKTKHFRVIVGLDETEMRWDEGEGLGSIYGEFKAAAPSKLVPVVVPYGKTGVLYGTGTSFAAPCWTSCVALLMSLDSGLTAPQADKIVFKTATRTAEGYRLPDLRKAVNKVLDLEP